MSQEIAAGEYKPPIVQAFEVPLAEVLRPLCYYRQKCLSVGLYDQNGELLAAAVREGSNSSDPDYLISDDLFQNYIDGTLKEPHKDTKTNKTVYPIYLIDNRYGMHKPITTDDPLVGFISYETK